MVEHARTHNQIELALQLADMFDRQLPDLEILQVVLLLQLLRVRDARGADVDSDHAGIWPAERVFGGLPRSAPGDQDVERRTVRLAGPQQVEFGPMAVRVSPLVTRALQIGDRWGIGMAGVELADRIGHAGGAMPLLFMLTLNQPMSSPQMM